MIGTDLLTLNLNLLSKDSGRWQWLWSLLPFFLHQICNAPRDWVHPELQNWLTIMSQESSSHSFSWWPRSCMTASSSREKPNVCLHSSLEKNYLPDSVLLQGRHFFPSNNRKPSSYSLDYKTRSSIFHSFQLPSPFENTQCSFHASYFYPSYLSACCFLCSLCCSRQKKDIRQHFQRWSSVTRKTGFSFPCCCSMCH